MKKTQLDLLTHPLILALNPQGAELDSPFCLHLIAHCALQEQWIFVSNHSGVGGISDTLV